MGVFFSLRVGSLRLQSSYRRQKFRDGMSQCSDLPQSGMRTRLESHREGRRDERTIHSDRHLLGRGMDGWMDLEPT